MQKISFINCLEAIAIFKNKKNNIAFLDVRTRKAYVQEFAFGAINCPLDRFSLMIADLVPDPSTLVIMIGANKKAIFKTNLILTKKKYSNVHYIKGDYQAWKKAKLPMWAGEFTLSKAFGEWIEATGKVNNIFPNELHRMHQQPNSQLLQIDARPKIEYEKFTLPYSKHCSGGELPAYLQKTSSKKTIIVHCAGRTRSIIAYQTLLDFNISQKKYVLNGGTQNWVLHGLERAYQQKSDIQKHQVNIAQDKKLAKTIIQKFKLPSVTKIKNIKGVHGFVIQSEIINNQKIPYWKNVNATTLVQNTDKFIASTSTPIYIYSDIPTSAVFSVLWLTRMGYHAIWHQDKPTKNLTYQYCNKNFSDPTYFFPKRHLGNKKDAQGYLDWEHGLIPTLQKWGCKYPWLPMNVKTLNKSTHPIHNVYGQLRIK